MPKFADLCGHAARRVRPQGFNSSSSPQPPLPTRAFNKADEIADSLYLIGVVVRNLDVHEAIFDHHHQFEAIEPVGPEVVREVRFIRNAFDIESQVVGDDCANVACGEP